MPARRRGTFHNIYLKLMAEKLKQGKSRSQIAREIASRPGVTASERTIQIYLYKFFPAERTKAGEPIDNLLWEARERISKKATQRELARKHSEYMKKRLAGMTPEERREWTKAGREAVARMTPEERRRSAKRNWGSLTRQQKTQKILALQKGRDRWWASLTPAEKRAHGEKALASLPVEERSRIATEREAAKRAKLFAGADYVRELPILNLLTDKEINRLYEKHGWMVEEATGKFRRRKDYEEVFSAASFGFSLALARWDKRMDLEKLMRDSIKYEVIDYFRREKRLEAATRFVGTTDFFFTSDIKGTPKKKR